MSEDEFQQQVIELARLGGWRVVHFRPARIVRDGKTYWRTPVQGDNGFPDLVLARRGLRIFAELKTDTGTVTADQQDWLDQLGPNDERTLVTVWRPRDWDRIQRTLLR